MDNVKFKSDDSLVEIKIIEDVKEETDEEEIKKEEQVKLFVIIIEKLIKLIASCFPKNKK